MKHTAGDRWFYHPSRKQFSRPEEFGISYESVRFLNDGHQLHGWFFPAVGDALGTVVHCHGNGGNISSHFPFVVWMPAGGWNVLVFDYQGFGQSEGAASRSGTITATQAAIRFVKRWPGVDESKVVIYGQSLGGSVAIVAAAREGGVRGVAVEGAFSSYQREAKFVSRQHWWLWGLHPLTGFFVEPGLDPIDCVGSISPVPMFFVTGTDDVICEPAQTIDLYEAAGEPKALWVIEGGRHMEALTHTDGEGPRRLDQFLRNCVSD